MNAYVISAYLISFALIAGELIFTISCYIKSKEILESLKDNNEEET
ncbi:heme exporter protein CcmD [Wolbachia endosymbiont of Atemnus politus]|nr:heme exporter protein CcmD [Wolbachia endosymbiont of Atemnus politus]NSM56742.1 heme exporter protein CcmD [Wolbachia endosymbiont of Atemnus politus]